MFKAGGGQTTTDGAATVPLHNSFDQGSKLISPPLNQHQGHKHTPGGGGGRTLLNTPGPPIPSTSAH